MQNYRAVKTDFCLVIVIVSFISLAYPLNRLSNLKVGDNNETYQRNYKTIQTR